MKSLAPLVRLETLDLSYTAVTGELSGLAPLVRLETLGLDGTAVTGGANLDALKAIQAKLTPAAAGSSI